ncbi:MAG: hypothetical protein AAF221_01815 [Pseudomonadota bacterium]
MRLSNPQWAPKPVWLLALAYGGSYAVFLLALRGGEPVAGTEPLWPALLTGFALGVLMLLPLPIALLKQRAKAFGQTKRPRSVWSGISAGFIALATAMAFSFDGVGILTALLFMRGGVLILSPLIDGVLGRSVTTASWAALILSLAAVLFAVAGLSTLTFSPLMVATLVVYLAGYGVRLTLMTRGAKTPSAGLRAAYLSQELVWTATVLAAASLALWLTQNVTLSAFLPFVPAGFAYASALTAGSLIYLDARENTFTIPINRGASLLAGLGVSASFAAIGKAAAPSGMDIAAACLILLALCVLALKAQRPHIFEQKLHSSSSPPQK